jgi:hypothetical protein
MDLTRWNNADPKPGHDLRQAFSVLTSGLDVANKTRAFQRRVKNVLDTTLYKSGFILRTHVRLREEVLI